jgi:2-keto-4-pentenoate hydratase
MSDGERIAQEFVAARREARALPAYPGQRPATLDAAYAIQGHAIAVHRGKVGGWKVGKIPPPTDAQLGTNRLAGPIFADQIVTAAAGLRMPVFEGGFGAAEAEYLLRIGTAPDPAKTHYTIEEATALIEAVHAGIEIASSPYPGINADGPLVTISDFGNNQGLVIGPEVPGWQSGEFVHWPVELRIEGERIGAARADQMLDGPFGAAAFLFGLAAQRGIALEAGQWISSGAVTGVHEIGVGQSCVAKFGDALEVSCSVGAAVPAMAHQQG